MTTEQLRIKELKTKLELAQSDLEIRMKELEQSESERNELKVREKQLEESLGALLAVVGLTPVLGNKEALQEAFDAANAVLKNKEGK